LSFKFCPVQQLFKTQVDFVQSNFASSTTTTYVWLPEYHEAKVLLDKYIEDVDFMHHVGHIPTIKIVLEEVYASLARQGHADLSQIILLLSIFASSTHFWVPNDCLRGLVLSPEEANRQAPFWIKATQDVLDIAHRITCISIEGIQGAINLMYVVVSQEGISRRGRSLLSMAIQMCRELGLHRLDHPENASTANSAQSEIGRRVWWYLVATDWYAHTSSSPLNKTDILTKVHRHTILKCYGGNIPNSSTPHDSQITTEYRR
jgi:hypothetical protein